MASGHREIAEEDFGISWWGGGGAGLQDGGVVVREASARGGPRVVRAGAAPDDHGAGGIVGGVGYSA